VAAQGREGLKQLLTIIADEKDARLPIDARASLILLAAQLQALHTMIGSIEKRRLLDSVPGALAGVSRLRSIHRPASLACAVVAATIAVGWLNSLATS
jgi:hypothetical protein